MNFQNQSPLSDAKNVEILKLLAVDPRTSVSELGRRVGMSPPAVKERLTRLEEAGVLRYRMEIDPRALGYPISAFVRIKPTPGQLSKIAELAKQMPEVTECHRVTGEDCFILKIHFASIGDDLDKILDQFLVYGQTTTSIVQSSPVPLRALPLPEAADS